MLHMSTSRCASGCIELPSCQIAVGSAALCPYGEHIHVQIEVLHTRRTLLHLASRHCSVFILSRHAEPFDAAHVDTSRCASGCIELPSCQIAVGSAVLCPYGVHIHDQIEVLHTRRTLLHLATRRCCVVMPCCNDITRCSSAVQARTFDLSSSSTQVIRISARVVDFG